MLAAGSIPLVVVFPTEEDVARYEASGDTRYAPLIAYLETRAYAYVDLMESLGAHPDRSALFDGCHYSPLANRLSAQHIQRAVLGLLGTEAADARLSAKRSSRGPLSRVSAR